MLLGLGSLAGSGLSVLFGSLPVDGRVADALADRLLMFLGGHVVDAGGQLVVLSRVPVGRGGAVVSVRCGCERVVDVGRRHRIADLQPFKARAQFFQPRARVGDSMPHLLDKRFPIRHVHRMRR